MEVLQQIGLIAGTSFSSGIRLYLTVAALGLVQKAGEVSYIRDHCEFFKELNLPGNLEALSNFWVIGVALFLATVEFFADKIPYFDSVWDSIHTFIRPIAGSILGFMIVADTGLAIQIPVALLAGVVSMDSHLTKATSRAAINTSPEPVSNITASLAEDGIVIVMVGLAVTYPITATILVTVFIIFSVWFLWKMFRFVKKLFRTAIEKFRVAKARVVDMIPKRRTQE